MKKAFSVLNKWYKMMNGTSAFHHRQLEGRFYSKDKVEGYYSDLRHKVEMAELIDENGVIYNITSVGNKVYFPISIFQYGLGAYDLFLETKDDKYKDKFFCSVKWALNNQFNNGAWDAFGWEGNGTVFSSMAQSEGASLLCRAYMCTGENEYLSRAKKAVEFMLISVDDGGTAKYLDDNIITLEEMPTHTTVLNGMIFSIWGLYDVCKLTGDEKLEHSLTVTIKTLKNILKEYDTGYWSNYDLDGNITSPFYHDLHIEQLKTMFALFGCEVFDEYAKKWSAYRGSRIKSKYAFIKKALQKLSKVGNEITLVK